MVEDFIHPDQRRGFCFHAKELFHGAGKIFRREVYPRELRHTILRELCEIPEKFHLPVVIGPVERAAHLAQHPTSTPPQVTVGAQVIGSSICLLSIERYMRRLCAQYSAPEQQEVATLVYENNDQARRLIRATHNYLKDNENIEHLKRTFTNWQEFFPIEKIAETAFFAEKDESSVLQVADAVAFAIARKLKNADHCDYLFEPLDKRLIVRPRSFGDPPNELGRVPEHAI